MHLVPVGSAGQHPALEAGDEVPLLLLVHDVQRHLQRHRLHVRPLQHRGHIHVHVQEPAHGSNMIMIIVASS